MHTRMALVFWPLTILAVGCGGSPEQSFPQAWTLEASAEAIELVEDLGWDPQSFYELVCHHAGEVCDGTGLTFSLDGGGGVIGVHHTGFDQDHRLGFAVSGASRADVNLGAIFDAIFGPDPGSDTADRVPIDTAAYLVAVIVAHEVGHAMTLPHNVHSTVMRASPPLLLSIRHHFTADEIALIQYAGGEQSRRLSADSPPAPCPHCGSSSAPLSDSPN